MLGIFIILLVGVMLVLPALPTIGLRVAGFSHIGDTDSVFDDSVPSIQIQDRTLISQGTITLGGYGSAQLDNNAVVIGNSKIGRAAQVILNESNLSSLCQQVSQVCVGQGGRFSNIRVDLKPDGAIVFLDVTELGVTQTVGLVLVFDSFGRGFTVAGVDIDGVLYDAPSNNIGKLVEDFERIGNEVMSQLSLQVGGERYVLSEARADDTTLTLLLR